MLWKSSKVLSLDIWGFFLIFEILWDQIVKTVGLILQCIYLESLLCFFPSVAKYGKFA